jgi:hypothetical protein
VIRFRVEDQEFDSKAGMLRHFGVSETSFDKRLKRGWTLDQALGRVAPPVSEHKSFNAWLRRRGCAERVCPHCKQQKPLTDFYLKSEDQPGDYYSYCKICTRIQVRHSSRQRQFGLTEEAWLTLFQSQGEACAVCRVQTSDSEWHTDHCHASGMTRGILCRNCNLLLGFAGDNVKTLQRAIQYLEGIAKNSDEYIDAEDAA